ncbi:MAG: CPXCG motif-containing cysteine-rich protein [Verrucomicrobiae bacterium]|nr:CPXCG motif-containing cysteine-rich protein [Verrucomicrobiae bacterium]
MELPYDIACPYCMETITIMIDTSGGDCELVQDCEVCCRPIRLQIVCTPGEIGSVAVDAE